MKGLLLSIIVVCLAPCVASAKEYRSIKVTVIYPDKEEKVFKFFPSEDPKKFESLNAKTDANCTISGGWKDGKLEHALLTCISNSETKISMTETLSLCGTDSGILRISEATINKKKASPLASTTISFGCD